VQRTVAMSQMRLSNDARDVFVTSALGSCVGLALYDPVACVGGMVHCVLPLSKIDPASAQTHPFLFVDTGVPALIQGLLDMGANKDRIVASVAGAATLLDTERSFRIGERNYIVLRKILWKNKIPLAAEATGGSVTRTLHFYMDTGRTVVKAPNDEAHWARQDAPARQTPRVHPVVST